MDIIRKSNDVTDTRILTRKLYADIQFRRIREKNIFSNGNMSDFKIWPLGMKKKDKISKEKIMSSNHV